MVDGKLPQVVLDCFQRLRASSNLDTPGLFRKVPNIVALQQLSDAYDRGHPISLSDWPDNCILASSLLKSYLRKMPTPLVPPDFYERIKRCPPITESEQDKAVRYLRRRFLPALEDNHPEGENAIQLLQEVIFLLKDVAARAGTCVPLKPVLQIKLRMPFYCRRSQPDGLAQPRHRPCAGLSEFSKSANGCGDVLRPAARKCEATVLAVGQQSQIQRRPAGQR